MTEKQIFSKRQSHMKLKHLGWFGCSQCNDCFQTEDKLATHSEKHKLIVKCKECVYIGKNKQTLQRHNKRIHELNPVCCTHCGKNMMNKRQLDDHMKHVKEYTVCKLCNKSLKQIRQHMKNVHMDDFIKSFQCEDCGKGFLYKIHLDRHKINVHIKTEPHKCRYGCDNKYNDLSNRNAHERRRHGHVYDKKSD